MAMITNLEHLEAHLYSSLSERRRQQKIKALVKDAFTLATLVIVVGIGSIFFINVEIFGMYINDFLFGFSSQTQAIAASDLTHEARKNNFSLAHTPAPELENLLAESWHINTFAVNYENQLKEKSQLVDFQFNLLPPENRIIIPSIDIDVPVVDLYYKPAESFEQWDYDQELYSWVVKYPTTPEPGEDGNVLIFGHTSFYRWKNNGYGTVFARIPKLKNDDLIQVVRNGTIHTYKVIEKQIVSPQHVKQTYLARQNGKFLTLMGCYPIGSDKDRILVIAEEVTGNKPLAYQH